MGGRKVGKCEPPNLICQRVATQTAAQHVGLQRQDKGPQNGLLGYAYYNSSNVAAEGKEREKVAPVRSCLLRQL